MRELEGLSHEEIAAALGISGGAARQAIPRARDALRDGLGAAASRCRCCGALRPTAAERGDRRGGGAGAGGDRRRRAPAGLGGAGAR